MVISQKKRQKNFIIFKMKDRLKIMYVNPIGFDAYDAFFAEMIKENKFSNTEVHITSLNPSVGQMDNLEYSNIRYIQPLGARAGVGLKTDCAREWDSRVIYVHATARGARESGTQDRL